MGSRIEYSDKYTDGVCEYRHVILPKELSRGLPKSRTMTEQEWRGIGVTMSRGWVHYALHRPEPHILLFKRPLGTDGNSGKVNPAAAAVALEEYRREIADKLAS